jgi:hypothetical protein
MTEPYSATKARREASALATTDIFADYCLALQAFMQADGDEARLQQSTGHVAIEFKRSALVPERLFHALRISACVITTTDRNASGGTALDRRYTRAIRMFLAAYFEK